jgi:hypothetical protein
MSKMWMFHSQALVGIELSGDLLVYQISKALNGVKYRITKDVVLKSEEEIADNLLEKVKKASKEAFVFDYIDLNIYLTRLKKGKKPPNS